MKKLLFASFAVLIGICFVLLNVEESKATEDLTPVNECAQNGYKIWEDPGWCKKAKILILFQSN